MKYFLVPLAVAASIWFAPQSLAQQFASSIINPDFVFQEVNGIVAVEAEHFMTQEMTDARAWYRFDAKQIPNVKPDPDDHHINGASSGGYLEVLPDTRATHDDELKRGENFFAKPGDAGVLTYRVAITNPGRYYVWVRHLSTGSEDNGVHVGIDRTWPPSGKDWQTIKKRKWDWECRQRTKEVHVGVPLQLYLDINEPGEHEIHFSIREDGFEFDKFILASDRNFVPDGVGPKPVVKTVRANRSNARANAKSKAVVKSESKVFNQDRVVHIPAPSFPVKDTNFYVHQKTWLAINPTQHKTATTSLPLTIDEGVYNLIFHAVGENDGQSTFNIKVGSRDLETFACPISTDMFELGSKYTRVFPNVAIKSGDRIEVTSTIGSADGSEYSRGRWVGITLLPQSASDEQVASARRRFPELAASDNAKPKAKSSSRAKQSDSVRPPAGRLAIVADGNSPDPDDIGATAVIFGLLHASGLNDRLVHLSHSCDLKPAARIAPADELRRQKVLHEICDYGVAKYGPFANLADHFNCRTDQQAAVDDLRDAINASSKTDPLWIIEAGEPDIIGYALQAADADKRAHVHVVSHHPANDNTGDFFSWQQILDFGVTEHQIGDQNVYLKSDIPPWDWAKDHADARIQWIWKQLAYAEQDGVVKFQAGHFDCSDAGMVYWWITGADGGGNKVATPVEIKAMLLRDAK